MDCLQINYFSDLWFCQAGGVTHQRPPAEPLVALFFYMVKIIKRKESPITATMAISPAPLKDLRVSVVRHEWRTT
jgi:hypothetical protein